MRTARVNSGVRFLLPTSDARLFPFINFFFLFIFLKKNLKKRQLLKLSLSHCFIYITWNITHFLEMLSYHFEYGRLG